MGYRFNVFDFLSFIIPGLLLILPLLVIPSLVSTFGLSLPTRSAGEVNDLLAQPLVTSLIVFVVSYVLGLLIYYIGRIAERKLLEPGEPPSCRVLASATTAALTSPVPDSIRSIARKHFRLPESASDSQVFSLIFRYLFMIGKAERTARFLHLRNLTRGATIVFLVWFVVLSSAVIITGPQRTLIGAALVSMALTVLADRVRRAYNRDIAEEVYVAYYVQSCRLGEADPCDAA